MDSQLLPRIVSSCNKYMIPCVLCLWGCTEYVFSCGHISLDTIFQRFLPKSNIDLIHNIIVLKYLQYVEIRLLVVEPRGMDGYAFSMF